MRPGCASAERAGAEGDGAWMARALGLANEAFRAGEVPVGAVVVGPDGQAVGEGRNRTLGDTDVTAHAEIVALRQAFAAAGNHRLAGHAIYTTLEPCAMCAGAILHARLSRLVFGARDPKFGACGSRADLFSPRHGLNHHTEVSGGVLADRSADLMRRFFAARR